MLSDNVWQEEEDDDEINLEEDAEDLNIVKVFFIYIILVGSQNLGVPKREFGVDAR